ncbi:MAG: biopolymer transporter ExbD [Gammaproteobacteria bacterium]|nr:biopolymer transporter ExbD [Gammaproteobacteria bacterium]
MKVSRRAKRMTRHHARTKRSASLNMVSLMDIFTILVFFLLVSSSSVQDLPNAKQVQLPESVSDQLPKETIVIVVGKNDIVVQGRRVASISDVMRGGEDDQEIEPLKAELLHLAGRKVRQTTPDGKPILREVTIMGDKNIPFSLLKKIMLTCTKASYTNISLAVLHKRQEG